MSERVPAEFVGKARVFRTNMIAATSGVGPQMRTICQYSFALYKRRNAAPRPEHLVAIEQRWRTLPTAGCVYLSVRRDQRSMSIEDTRIIATTSTNIEWGDGSEKSICLTENSLALTRRHAETKATTIAAMSLHAIGRWYQRARTTSESAILHDLALVVAAAPTLDPNAIEVEVPSRNCGSWRGGIVETLEGAQIINIRTFV